MNHSIDEHTPLLLPHHKQPPKQPLQQAQDQDQQHHSYPDEDQDQSPSRRQQQAHADPDPFAPNRPDGDAVSQDRDQDGRVFVPLQSLRRWDLIYTRAVKVVGMLLLACLAIVALYPLLAQRVLDHGLVLDIHQTTIDSMDSTGFHILLHSTISLNTSKDGLFGLSRLVEAMQPLLAIEPTVLSMGLPDLPSTPMANFSVEGQSMRMGQPLELHISTHVSVTNATLMARFFGETLQHSIVHLSVRGPLLARLGPLWWMTLQLDRSVALEGLEGIQDASLVSMALPREHDQGGIVMEAVARITNPSTTVSLHMDAVKFGVYLPSQAHTGLVSYRIAELQCNRLGLDAGASNDLVLKGRLFHLDDWSLDQGGIHGAIQGGGLSIDARSEKQLLLSRLLTRFIQGDNSTIQVKALANDPDLPPWLAMAFRSILLDLVFPGSLNKDFIRSLDMNELSFGFADQTTSALLTGQLASSLQLPPNVTFPIKILKMKPNARLRSPEGKDMAYLDIPDFLPTDSHQKGTHLAVSVAMRDTVLNVLPDRMPEFYEFLNSSFSKDWIELGIAGDAMAVVETGLGTFELGPIAFEVTTVQRGLGGLVSVAPVLEKLDVVDSTDSSVTVKATLVLWNPSNISASLGDLSFLWAFSGYTIGMATVGNVHLQAGNNTIECAGMMNPSLDCARKHDPDCDPDLARNASRAFISQYISGDNSTTIQVLGYPGTTRIPLLQPMLSSFSLESHLPVIEDDFLISATMYLLSSTIVMELRNPLDTVITVLYINGTASYKDEPLGHILVDFEKDIASPKPILIPANDHQNETSGYVKTPRLPVMFELSSVGYEALKRALGGSIEVDVLCHIKAKVGQMVVWVDYVKDGIEANVRKGF